MAPLRRISSIHPRETTTSVHASIGDSNRLAHPGKGQLFKAHGRGKAPSPSSRSVRGRPLGLPPNLSPSAHSCHHLSIDSEEMYQKCGIHACLQKGSPADPVPRPPSAVRQLDSAALVSGTCRGPRIYAPCELRVPAERPHHEVSTNESPMMTTPAAAMYPPALRPRDT